MDHAVLSPPTVPSFFAGHTLGHLKREQRASQGRSKEDNKLVPCTFLPCARPHCTGNNGQIYRWSQGICFGRAYSPSICGIGEGARPKVQQGRGITQLLGGSRDKTLWLRLTSFYVTPVTSCFFDNTVDDRIGRN